MYNFVMRDWRTEAAYILENRIAGTEVQRGDAERQKFSIFAL